MSAFSIRAVQLLAELPEHAPARTLVMAKALRNMLEQRSDNPTPKHEEFLARAQAAEDLAVQRLQQGILADIASGSVQELSEKLRFLNVAAGAAQSPELFSKVLDPIDKQLAPILEKRAPNDRILDGVITNKTLSRLRQHYQEGEMLAFMGPWHNLSVDAKVSAFVTLPEAGQKVILKALTDAPIRDGRLVLSRMLEQSQATQREFLQKTLETTQDTFERQALDLHHDGQPVPDQYAQWLDASANPEIRITAMQLRHHPLTSFTFGNLTKGLEPAALRQLLIDDAMAYAAGAHKAAIWSRLLSKMPQDEQIKLFSELAQKHAPAYQKVGDSIAQMDATEFDANRTQIQDDSLKIIRLAKAVLSLFFRTRS